MSKALRLARYLKEFVGLRSTTVRDVNKYESVVWFGDLPQEPDCRSPAWNDGGELGGPWLEVHKQQFPKLPTPPHIILPWIDQQSLNQAAEEMPQLRLARLEPDLDAEIGDGEEPPLVERHLADCPEVTEAYDRYRPSWEDWSQKHRRCERIQTVYAELFKLRTQVQKQGEIVELVLGLGLLDWRNPIKGKSIPILRHIVTARVDLHFEPDGGIIRLEGAASGAKLQIEDDMLEAEARPERSHYASVEEQLNAVGDAIWDRPNLDVALRFWAGALDANSEWSPGLKPTAGDPRRPSVTFAPALILRKRNQAGMVRVYENIINRLSKNVDDVPSGWGGLIDDGADRDDPGLPQGRGGKSANDLGRRETYFPLPANREQRRIVEAIDRGRGVLVQGPPGTGKSHTIANLVCHLLATGQRVLITAETGRALQVLKEKLPEEIRPLCISLLGQGGDAFAELNTAVQGITARFDSWTPGAYNERIDELDRELDAQRRALAAIDAELRSLREDETCPHSLMNGAYIGTASVIAERVATERDRFGWFSAPRSATDDPPVSSADMMTWLRVSREYSDEHIANSMGRVCNSEQLPQPVEFDAVVRGERDAWNRLDRFAELRRHPAYGPVLALSEAQRLKLAETLRDVEQRRESLRRLSYRWLPEAIVDVLGGRKARWLTLIDQSKKSISKIERLLDKLGSSTVSIPAARNANAVRSDAGEVIRHLEAGGKWNSFIFISHKAVKERLYLRDEVQVDGQPANNISRLHVVCSHLDLMLAIAELEQAWEDLGGLPPGSQLRIRLAAIKEQIGILAHALDYAEACLDLRRTLNLATPPVPEPNWLSGQARELLRLIEISAFEERYRQASGLVTACMRELHIVRDRHDAHPIVGQLIGIVEQRDVIGYSQAYERIREIEQAKRDQQFRQSVESTLRSTVPGLLETVTASINDPLWDDRLCYWERAWCWGAADNWLQKRTDFSYQQLQLQQRRDIERTIGELLAELAARRAWTHFFDRLSDKEAAALKSWREAVKAMGKGTGRSARMERLRRDARKYMDLCREAIPVWIMPRYIVAEMVDPAPNRYDLVIVDEASQLGIESLFLFYISKKMVVVGDDQQISPYGVGIADDAIANLQHHYLNDIPHHHAFSAQSSLYANAKIRFRQNIVLREHFRCMPEIIQFSNDLCYASNGTPLDPLRTYTANRLKPLVLRYVSEGYRTGGIQHALNEPEADAILSQIVACIGDPRYADRTMGVISLQGDAQARLIEHKILKTLEPEVIEKRRLICGDAYAFQGDERHIIFLSMVAAPGETKIGTLSTESARQRFNVAVSRAQDQLWLFHSASIDVLSTSCMRHRLLRYMLDPRREPPGEPHRFDSQFERDVFELIRKKGFHVRSQVCVGDPTNHRYRIDLVVEGMQGRLAVECDGDKWHGPERYDQDMARQRDLERAGWQFIRIRGSDFYRDQDRSLELLWAELERQGIRPGALDGDGAEPPDPVHIIDPGDPVEELEEEQPPESNPEDHVMDGDPNTAGLGEGVNGLAGFALDAYVNYDGPGVSDPRTVNLSVVADGLRNIIEIEGPMIAKRAYDIYLRNCGVSRLGGELKRTLNKALMSAIRQGRIISENEQGNSGLIFSTVRCEDAPAVRIRELGSRSLAEIPPGELRAVGSHISDKLNIEYRSDEHLRAILEIYGFRRLTTQIRKTLLDSLNSKS